MIIKETESLCLEDNYEFTWVYGQIKFTGHRIDHSIWECFVIRSGNDQKLLYSYYNNNYVRTGENLKISTMNILDTLLHHLLKPALFLHLHT